MATPNDPVPQKKPAAPGPQGQPAAGKQPAPRPGAPKPVAGKPAAPAKPGNGKPAPAKPQAPSTKPAAAPAARKPAAPVKASGSRGGGSRKLGQVLVDLGFLDEDQLWEVLEEGKNTAQPVGQVAVSRGYINEEQLLQALGEQHNLKVVNLQDTKSTPEALALVPETMASIYKVVPLSVKDKVLTIALGDPHNLAAVDDLRNLLSLK